MRPWSRACSMRTIADLMVHRPRKPIGGVGRIAAPMASVRETLQTTVFVLLARRNIRVTMMHPLTRPVTSSTILDMTTQGYVNLSIKPTAKRALELLALDLSKEMGRRVTLSEALERAMIAIYVDEVDVAAAMYNPAS